MRRLATSGPSGQTAALLVEIVVVVVLILVEIIVEIIVEVVIVLIVVVIGNSTRCFNNIVIIEFVIIASAAVV